MLIGDDRDVAIKTLRAHHYTRSVPSGKSYYFDYEGAIIVYSIPANKNISKFLLGMPDAKVWELTRLWAPDEHAPNLLTQAISRSVGWLRKIEPDLDALVSYADPNVGHTGGVYRAASWIAHGQSEEVRAYRSHSGEIKARRAFHSGSKGMVKAEIEALGYSELKLLGKFRFVKPLSRRARRKFTSVAQFQARG